jgi:hypothetical protein
MKRPFVKLLLVGILLAPALASAVTEEDFRVETTRNLLNLCTAPVNDSRYEEAIHFCHGFLVGAFRYHVAENSGPGGKLLVCFPNPPPTRNEAIAMFIDWAQAHPQYMDNPPVETEFRFLTEKWPCKN